MSTKNFQIDILLFVLALMGMNVECCTAQQNVFAPLRHPAPNVFLTQQARSPSKPIVLRIDSSSFFDGSQSVPSTVCVGGVCPIQSAMLPQCFESVDASVESIPAMRPWQSPTSFQSTFSRMLVPEASATNEPIRCRPPMDGLLRRQSGKLHCDPATGRCTWVNR